MGLMRELPWPEFRRARKVRTTMPGKEGQRAGDWATATYKRIKPILDALRMAPRGAGRLASGRHLI